ncbi:hypothetical protein DMUE_4375 [Dictyocoela muelleri]|nr:hypothetical protein DMUE_4375 [Dictyocoela muelleri]
MSLKTFSKTIFTLVPLLTLIIFDLTQKRILFDYEPTQIHCCQYKPVNLSALYSKINQCHSKNKDSEFYICSNIDNSKFKNDVMMIKKIIKILNLFDSDHDLKIVIDNKKEKRCDSKGHAIRSIYNNKISKTVKKIQNDHYENLKNYKNVSIYKKSKSKSFVSNNGGSYITEDCNKSDVKRVSINNIENKKEIKFDKKYVTSKKK